MKIKIKSLIAGAISLSLMTTVLAGCTQGSKEGTTELKNTKLKLEGQPVKNDKVLTTLINVQSPPAFNGNPYDVAGLDWSVQPLVYDYLADFSPFPSNTYKESLLESYKQEGKVLTMKLKKDLKWSDGSPLTSEDIMTNYYVNVGKSAIWTFAEKIEKIDDLTVRITFVNESPLALKLAFALPIMSPAKEFGKWAAQYKVIADTQRVLKSNTNTYDYTPEGQAKLTEINNDLLAYKPDPTKVIASGPYVISGVTTSEVTFKKNPQYRIDVKIETVRGLRPGSAEAFSTSILEQQYTMENGGLSPDTSKQVDSRYKDTMRKIYIPELSQIGFVFNTAKYPVNIPEVRKAITMATNRETLVNIAEPGSFLSDTRNSGLMPSLIKNYTNEGFIDTLPDYKYDTDKAAKLLESIGWKKNNAGIWTNEKGEEVPIEIATINSWPSLMMTSEAMASMLSEFGFKVNFKPMEGGTIWSYLSSPDAMIGSTFLGAAGTYAHPWEAFNNILTSTRVGFPKIEPGQDRIVKAPTSGKEYNVTQMLRQLFASKDEKETKKLTEELMTLLNDISVFMPVIEKSAPFRIYDPSLSLADGKAGEIQESYYYFGTMNQVLSKLIKDGEIYYVDEKK